MWRERRKCARLQSCVSGLLFFCMLALSAAVRDSKYYKVLGISEDADEATIKKAYRKAALKWHPDRNQDNKEKAEEKFREIAAAYETLTDPEKRRLYDQLGEDGIKQGGHPGAGGGPGGGASFQFQGDPFEVFNTFFGGSHPFGGGVGGGNVHFSMGGMGGGMPGMGGMGGMPGMGGMGGMPGMGGKGGMPGMGGGQRREKRRQQQPQGDGGGGLYGGDPNVTDVTSSNFPSKSDSQVWLLEFYAPWCGHCRNLAPKWSKVAASLKGIVRVGAVNCDVEKQLCGQHQIQGFPTIKAFVKGRLQEYQGDRSAAALRNFALGLLSSKAVRTVNRPAQVEELLESCNGQWPKKAAWGACVILFTSKTDTAPLTKSLASQFEGKLAFGESRASNAQLAKQFNISSYPTFIAVCNGDASAPILYSGAFKAEPLRRFLQEFQGGRKCAKMVKISADTDFGKLRVSRLKDLLRDRGVVCLECAEKKDFVQKLREVVAATAKQ